MNEATKDLLRCQGGRNASKSTKVERDPVRRIRYAKSLIEWCADNPNAGWVFTIVRKTMPALRASVMRDFFQILENEDWYNEAGHNKSQNTYALFGNLVEFISADQPQKLRGRKRQVCFINEANELTLEDFRQLNLRTTVTMILDYNPSDFFSWIYDDVLVRAEIARFSKPHTETTRSSTRPSSTRLNGSRTPTRTTGASTAWVNAA